MFNGITFFISQRILYISFHLIPSSASISLFPLLPLPPLHSLLFPFHSSFPLPTPTPHPPLHPLPPSLSYSLSISLSPTSISLSPLLPLPHPARCPLSLSPSLTPHPLSLSLSLFWIPTPCPLTLLDSSPYSLSLFWTYQTALDFYITLIKSTEEIFFFSSSFYFFFLFQNHSIVVAFFSVSKSSNFWKGVREGNIPPSLCEYFFLLRLLRV